MWFSRKKEVERGAFVRGAKIFFATASFAAATANAKYAAVGSAAEGAHNLEMRWRDFDGMLRDANRSRSGRRCGILRQWSTDSNS